MCSVVLCCAVLVRAVFLCVDYTFSSLDYDFLEMNFTPALFENLPWVWVPGSRTVVGRKLLHAVSMLRQGGMSFEAIVR